MMRCTSAANSNESPRRGGSVLTRTPRSSVACAAMAADAKRPYEVDRHHILGVPQRAHLTLAKHLRPADNAGAVDDAKNEKKKTDPNAPVEMRMAFATSSSLATPARTYLPSMAFATAAPLSLRLRIATFALSPRQDQSHRP
ncbi:hypothetical protein DQ04_03161010 [Trypanosoma grayi]|uniref:hypothetical protein n=1 Tax=Trypanosoma grayi TaxID=71804 RepID=UPI0004F40684|nr:hypothetical protein DQ04_03161010 [Trypanosoma grayi]KEG10905.1 hypothetical protein DQ04_03161010 [Trypanosoma grayi]